MDLLRFLLLLPIRAIGFVWRLLGRVLRPLLGDVSWTAPAWLGLTATAVRRRPWHAGGAVLLAAALAAAGYWYKHRPKPPEPATVGFTVKAPAVTAYEVDDSGKPKLTVHPLEVAFAQSAAPIELVGKPAGQGIEMTPALKGAWEWADDKTLRFTPAADWPVGAHVEVRFAVRQAFAPQVTLQDDHFAFDIPAFAMQSSDNTFYQNPDNPAEKQALLQLNFNYPVDPAELEKRIGLVLVGRDGKTATPLRYTVSYDTMKMRAWVRSQPLEIPRDPLSARLDVDKGVKSARGGAGTQAALQAAVAVPGLYSLSIGDVSPTLVDNERYEPEQVLVAQASDGVRSAELAARAKAWVLPKRKPGVDQSDDDPPYEWNVADISDAVLKQSKPLPLEAIPTEDDYATMQSFKYHATPGDRVYVRFDDGLKSAGGYLLGKPVTRAFTVPDYPKLLRFMADGSLLSMSGSKRLSVVSRNLPGMKVEIGRVVPDQLQHLVSFNNGSYSRPELSYSFSEDHIVERFVQKRAFPSGDPGKAHYEGIDLGQYLKGGKRGVFLLHLSKYDPAAEKKKSDDAQEGDASSDGDNSQDQSDQADSGDAGSDDDSALGDTRLIVVTDLGMLVKRALDGSQDVFIQSIRSGRPVAGATVSVLAVNGQALFTQTTSADGVVHFPAFKGLDREKRPQLYVVKKDGDLSFLPVGGRDRQLDFSRFDVDGERNATGQGQLSAYLFSDRGLYRPGDPFHIGLIVRAASWARSPAGVPLQAEIVDSRGITVERKPVSVDATGFTELDYTTAETAPTGTWTVNLYIMKNGQPGDEPIGSTTVQVKEFLPDRMKVDARLSQQVLDGWVKPKGLKGIVDAQNLFGTPAEKRRVAATLTLRPVWPSFRNWQGYRFFDARRAKEGYTTTLQDGTTDDKGHAEFDLDLDKYADATYQLYFQAKAYEAEGGRNVAANAQTLVSNNDWLVGYRSVDDLGYVKRGSPRTVRLVAIDPNAKAIEVKGLRAQLVEERYVSVLTRQDSGVYKYDSRLKEVPVDDKPLAIPAAGIDFALRTDKPGSYALVIRDANGGAVNRIGYAVAGDANVTRSLDRNAELQVSLAKHDYKPGEQVEIAIRAPYAGSGLITIERDKVYAHAWFHADTTSSIQHITVPAGFEGNGYINVQYIRDPSSDEIFMSPLSYGVVPFSVNLDARRNALTVDAPALVKPGDTVNFTVHSAKPAKVVVFAVDEGILQVARYKLGDPLKFFFRKRMLEVGTSQILDLILPDFDKLMSMAAPGGDADDAIGRQLNPFRRKRDKPVVYWSGIVDVNGDTRVSYTVPDYFNGKLRVMAVSVSPDLVGTFEGATTVRGDFVLSPNVPTTLAPGDEADVSVGVANNLTGAGNQPVPVAVTLKTGPQLQVIGAATQNVALAPQHEGVALFRVRATDTLGSGTLSFGARYGAKGAQQNVDVSVRPAAAFRTQLDVGRLDAGKKASVPNLRPMYDAYASRDASMSTAPLVLSEGLSSYLVNFDHYCSEQMVSAVVPRLFASNWLSVRALTSAMHAPEAGADAANANAVAQFFGVLRGRQNAQGGFGLWSATPDADPFVSAYAMHVLIDARERGAAVPKDMLDAGTQYLQKLAANDALGSLDLLRQRAYAVYLLTRLGNVTTNSLATVQKRLQDAYPDAWKNDLAAAWLAASYRLLKQDKEAATLIAGPQALLERRPRADDGYATGYYLDPLTRDASVLYLLAKHFPERARSLSPRAMDNIAAPIVDNRFNTLSSAMTILALDAYAASNAGQLDRLAIDEIRAGAATKDVSSIRANLVRSGTWAAGASRVDFVNGSALPAWWVASQSGYDRGTSKQAIRNGLEIVRDYTDTNGKPLDKIVLGQEIDVHLKIRATGSASVGNVAIVDLLPGGFDPVIAPPPATNAQDGSNGDGGASAPAADAPWRSPIGVAGSTWQPQFADVREDRVVIYGTATSDVREFVYRIKASNAGRFIVPPAYGESMYDRRLQAQAPGGAALTVERAR
ncbi:alpha-2-macroglobulin family protein [Burkholderia pseudomultivorans]|uniref:Lipoprotein YfhM n=1 Tax=Burkholderia pseudomultivorans TaxID=1207504 RepID=A0ABU2DZ41_9BURK|nr:alpha-2-macroglobulin [Burkholderia pseudomultivorans]MDR8726934.1 putative lipoprotein YfhM [Burkholderia pseudomultivorans]MDR8735903.1 putative lipoprotein YfhM [Burkholderia pseudomultivorans]MDR8741879.1 putative lipoprotein YfhM [Burkholderia pseudomultivorans]MDR8752693.1 putative lipoprotein YfhM [Burkholderia pseudomultivorans]MDR8778473.1 putative lipoprotein YfhM [Burkholderia pseudomultivorans]